MIDGVMVGLALLNSLNLKDADEPDLKSGKSPPAMYILTNFIVFAIFFFLIVFRPKLFLNVSPRVNVFVHGTAFYISFLLTVLVYPKLMGIWK